MTKDQLKVPAWAITGIVLTLLALGAARQQLNGKEDKADHDADVIRLQGAADLRQVKADARAQRTEAMLRDLVCPTNPQKDYCKP